MKTALTELIEELEQKRDMWNADGNMSDRRIRGAYIDAIIVAKGLASIEEKQIKDAANGGALIWIERKCKLGISTGQQYYQETYGSTP